MAGLGAKSVFDQVQGLILKTGLFARVNTSEPASAPVDGPHCAVYVRGVGPVPDQSGLASTSGVVFLFARLYLKGDQEPRDMIDPSIVAATDTIMGDLSADFTLGGTVGAVDLLGGLTGTPLSAEAGWIEQDGTRFRTMDITIPVLIHDAWPQAV
jgi:hypothetical protein